MASLLLEVPYFSKFGLFSRSRVKSNAKPPKKPPGVIEQLSLGSKLDCRGVFLKRSDFFGRHRRQPQPLAAAGGASLQPYSLPGEWLTADLLVMLLDVDGD